MRASEDLVGALRGGFRGSWERFWFAEGSLVRLAVFRMVCMATGLFALRFTSRSLLQGDGGNEFLSRPFVPVYFLEVLGIGPLSPDIARVLFYALFVLLLLGFVGLFARVACALSAVGLLLWLGMAYSYGKPHHEYGILAFALVALPFGPVGARLSLDSWLARWRSSVRTGVRASRPEYAPLAVLPLRFVQVSLGLSYLFAGATKLRIGGAEWMNGYTLQGFMLEFNAPLTDAVASKLGLLKFLSVGVIVTQIASASAVVWRPLRWFFVPGIIAVHMGSMLMMHTGTFMGLWLMQAAFVDWERLPAFFDRCVATGGIVRRAFAIAVAVVLSFGLIYYYQQKAPAIVPWMLVPVGIAAILRAIPPLRGELRMPAGSRGALGFLACVDALNWSARIRVEDAATTESTPATSAPQFTNHRGKVSEGLDTYRAVAWRLPLIVPLAPLLYLPGAGALARVPASRAKSGPAD